MDHNLLGGQIVVVFDTKILLTMDASLLSSIRLSSVDITLIMCGDEVTLICW